MRRRFLQLMVALMVTALPLVAAVAPARADNAGVLLGLVNTLRAIHGARPLSADPILSATAQAWSAHMAATGVLGHNPNDGAGVPGGWTKLGENVGEGGVLTAIYNAFVASPFHFGNMVDPSYNLTGIAVAIGRGNTLWVTEDFEARPGATPVTTAAPATAPPTVATTRPPTSSSPHAAVTVPAATVPNTGTPTTAPPTTVTPVTDSTTTMAGNDAGLPGSGSAPATGQLPSRDPKGPGDVRATATLSPARGSGGSVFGWPLALTALVVLLVGGGAYVVKKTIST